MAVSKFTDQPKYKEIVSTINELVDAIGSTSGANIDLSNLSATGESHFQVPLVSGTNIKTINNTSLLGNGDITISAAHDVDNTTITQNSDDELQTVAVIDNRSGNAIKTWTGTRAQYNAIVTKDANTLYSITDDTSPATDLYSVLELMYPIGSIYIGTMATCPLETLGIGTWQLVASDMTLQGKGTGNSLKDELPLDVKLPNITGSARVRGFVNDGNHCVQAFGNGALYDAGHSASDVMASGTGGGTFLSMALDASRSSSVYSGNGTDTKVQVPAYIVNIWERIT